jgi:glycerate 2-kinase
MTTFVARLARIAVSERGRRRAPVGCLPPNLPEPPPRGRLIILAAGKAAGSMTEVAERHYLAQLPPNRLAGIAVTRHGYGRPTRHIPVIEAGHPVPDAAGLCRRPNARWRSPMRRRRRSRAGAPVRRRLGELDRAGPGHHARREAGGDPGAVAQRRRHRRDQLRAQASLPHQGRPARPRAHPAKVVTLAISDVPGDDPPSSARGRRCPTRRRSPTPAPSPPQIPAGAARRRSRARSTIPANESPKPGEAIFAGSDYRICGPAGRRLARGRRARRAAGYDCVMLGDRLQGEAREVAAEHARLARELQRARAAAWRSCPGAS